MQTGNCSPIELGVSADTRHCYDSAEPGCECSCSKPTQLNRYAIDHISRDHPERQDWLSGNLEAVRNAVTAPDILSAELQYKTAMKHWTQCRVIEHPGGTGNYLVVVLSLATLEGRESEFHQVITVYPAERRKFFNKQGNLKLKWQTYKIKGLSPQKLSP